VIPGLFGAAGAWGQCAPAAPVGRGRPAPQLHRWVALPRAAQRQRLTLGAAFAQTTGLR
jgi:hypothetical protein